MLDLSIHLFAIGRGNRDFAHKLDLGTFEVLAAVEEPLDGADDEDDEEGDDAVICVGEC